MKINRKQRLHQRTVEVSGYLLDDGRYEIEAHLVDVKGHDVEGIAGTLVAGQPIHDMWMRWEIDDSMTILAVETEMKARPYPGYCEAIVPDYRALEGLVIAPGFSHQVRERFGGLKGCSHLTELTGVMATAAFQTRYGALKLGLAVKPPHLDGCHALNTAGPVVARFYPQWRRKEQP